MRKILIISIVGLLTSCGIYKPYSRPEMLTEGLYREVQLTDTISLASLSWRDLFTDKQLQALIERGLRQNTDLRIAHLRVEEAKAVLMNARLSYLPTLSLSPEGNISKYDGIAAKTYNLGASASWEIDIFGKVTNAKRGAKAALEASRAYEQAVQTQLVATIANSYYTLLMLDQQLIINERTLENWAQTEKTMEALKRAGKSNDAAVLQARSSRMALEASVLTIRKNIQDTENGLSVLLAMAPQFIERGTLNEQHFTDDLSVGIPVQLLSNRPDVRQAEYNLAQAFYATNAARSAFYPSITLSGNAGWTNNSGTAILNPGNWLLNAIGSLTQPLFNRGTNIANLKIAKARQEETVLTFQQSLLDAGKEANDALTLWQTAQKRIEIGNEQIATLQEAVFKTELLMKHSSTNYLEVLTAQQTLLSAELTQAQDQFDKIQGVINLYHALGGGI
ncbi:MAG: efflux transporter outer membrane subunit [Alistipes sp.]|uniref:efflux transporter outer membrane subunit n=1 Tax=Alistipes sp. TaxID=1872444 RepID=UPI0025B9F267|nr:efflux transporter outer membrane subunit [Alistipes sp.]MCD8276308.1 efflux transporter outer membrane subunit [Alistipes sp.]